MAAVEGEAIKVIFCLRRREGLTRAEFQSYWLEHHGDLVKRLASRLGMVRYVQNHTIESRLGDVFRKARGAGDPYDGVMEGWWESEAAAFAALRSAGDDVGTMLIGDEARFIDLERSSIFFAVEREIYRAAP